MNKGGAKKFQFGFPSKKSTAPASDKPAASNTAVDVKRKAPESATQQDKGIVKKPRALVVDDDEDEFLASAGIGETDCGG